MSQNKSKDNIVPASLTAKVVGCQPDMVRKVRKGERKATGKVGENIAVADIFLMQKMSSLIQEAKRLIHL